MAYEMDDTHCDICSQPYQYPRHERYGSRQCPHCGQRYEWTEDSVPFLDDEQIEVLRRLNMERISRKDGAPAVPGKEL